MAVTLKLVNDIKGGIPVGSPMFLPPTFCLPLRLCVEGPHTGLGKALLVLRGFGAG
jgi:hypothetical protein